MPPNRANKHGKDSDSQVGRTSRGINDPQYTARVKNRLQTSVLDIVKLDASWQEWVVDHPECLPDLPESDVTLKSFFQNKKYDVLVKVLMSYIQSKKRLSPKEKSSIKKILTRILVVNGEGDALKINNFLKTLGII